MNNIKSKKSPVENETLNRPFATTANFKTEFNEWEYGVKKNL